MPDQDQGAAARSAANFTTHQASGAWSGVPHRLPLTRAGCFEVQV
jgi:hypothetical protein